MTQIYDKHLSRDIDKVRFLIRDTDQSNLELEDEEIEWLLAQRRAQHPGGNPDAIVLLAAWDAGGALLANGRGIEEERIGDLMTQYGTDAETAYRTHLRSLRERGAELLRSKPRAFEVL